MTSGAARVLLVGFQDNLGLGYLASSLKVVGHEVRIETFETNPLPLLHLARQWNPDIVGFSLIFQFMAPEFAKTIRALRRRDRTLYHGRSLRFVCARNTSPTHSRTGQCGAL